MMGLFGGTGLFSGTIPGTGWTENLLNPGKGYSNAQDQSNQYYNQSNQMLQPYTQAGITGNEHMNDIYAQLMHPEQMQQQWIDSYKMSPQAHQLQQSAMDSGLNTAGSMGLLGSSSALSNIQNQSSDIANADLNNYMQQMMKLYLEGLGIAKNQFQGGAQAAGVGAGHAMDQGTTQANLEFGKYNAGPEMLMNLLMGGGKMAMGGM